MAFLDGPPPTRLCQPMVDYITARGGEVRLNAPVREIVLDKVQTLVKGLRVGAVSFFHVVYGKFIGIQGYVVDVWRYISKGNGRLLGMQVYVLYVPR